MKVSNLGVILENKANSLSEEIIRKPRVKEFMNITH